MRTSGVFCKRASQLKLLQKVLLSKCASASVGRSIQKALRDGFQSIS
jgi:hypothetical protein